jgi:hypothetical protein
MLATLITQLRRAKFDITAQELADALWLATRIDSPEGHSDREEAGLESLGFDSPAPPWERPDSARTNLPPAGQGAEAGLPGGAESPVGSQVDLPLGGQRLTASCCACLPPQPCPDVCGSRAPCAR